MVGEVTKVSPEELKSILEKKQPTLLDFFATWCGPCVAISPKIDDLAAKNTDITFLKVDVDAAEELCGEYQITAMPTFIAFKDGKECGRVIGGAVEKVLELVEKLKA